MPTKVAGSVKLIEDDDALVGFGAGVMGGVDCAASSNRSVLLDAPCVSAA